MRNFAKNPLKSARIHDAQSAIKAYGGTARFSRHFNFSQSRTSNYKAANSFPPLVALRVYADLHDAGAIVTPESLGIDPALIPGRARA